VTSFTFGPFTLVSGQRLLLKGGVPVRVGDRAIEILLALLERPGEVVDKDELFARVWPGIHVEKSALRVHVAALRKALDETTSAKYVAAVAGHGYRFVSPVIRDSAGANTLDGHQYRPRDNLPNRSTRIFGRDACIDDLHRQCSETQLLTIVGAGGIGKTTVALAVARLAAENYLHGAWFVDFSSLTDPAFLVSAIAAAVGLDIHSEEPEVTLRGFLRNRTLLLVLDNCEHLIAPVAAMVERILSEATHVRVIATSREPLRARGERIYRLPPLDMPTERAELQAAEAIAFPAIQLFVERASASYGEFDLDDKDVPLVTSICRELDGIALAIELAATRVSGLGLKEIYTLLADRFRLLNKGSRTAPQRQQTLNATLDWSFRLLTSAESVVLQRLSLFAGSFGLRAAVAVAALGSVGSDEVTKVIGSLVEKSLVSTDALSGQYRLLETTRAFARERLEENGELESCSGRHAEYFLSLLQSAALEFDALPTSEWLIADPRTIDDVRAALRWSFAEAGDRLIGVSLVVAAVPLWARLSLIGECRSWAERVLAEPKSLTDQQRMKLSVALALVLLYTRGPSPQINELLCSTLPLARRLTEKEYVLRSLYGLAYYSLYAGHHRETLKSLRRVARAVKNSALQVDCDRLEASTLHYMGEHARARKRLTRLLEDKVVSGQERRLARFHLDHRVSARCILAHVLMAHGFLDQAKFAAQAALRDSQALGHSISIENSLAVAAIPVAYYRGELDEAEEMLALLNDQVAQHSFVVGVTACLRSAVLVAKGDQSQVDRLGNAVNSFRAAGFGVRYASYQGMFAQALGGVGRMTEAHSEIEKAIRWSRKHEEAWCLPELLRIKGELLRLDGKTSARRAAESQFAGAIALAKSQKALIWELRASIDLARLLRERDKGADAYRVLSSAYKKFSEGFGTRDLRTAATMLEELAIEAGPARADKGGPARS
jgi:predicted ATPase/DNA-binding winged helix-turn-helix (wHTH) protein